MSLLRGVTHVALLFSLLFAPAAAIAQDAPTQSGPDPAALRAIEAQVSQIRGLPAQAEVSLRVLDEAGLQQYLLDAFERDYLPGRPNSARPSGSPTRTSSTTRCRTSTTT